jgi:hypothetical protein
VSYYDDLLATTPASTTAPDAFAGLLDAGTSRLTGLSPRDVVRRGLVRGQIPLYGLAGLSAGAGLLYNGGGLDDDAAY